jgi:hypothetical protein
MLQHACPVSCNTVTHPNSRQVALPYVREIRSRVSINFPRDTPVKVTLFARPLFTPVSQKMFRCELGVFISKRVFNLEHHFVSKSFDAVRETFNNAYPDR